MKHLGIEATKQFNRLQSQIKERLNAMAAPLEPKYETYTERRLIIDRELQDLLEERDKYI